MLQVSLVQISEIGQKLHVFYSKNSKNIKLRSTIQILPRKKKKKKSIFFTRTFRIAGYLFSIKRSTGSWKKKKKKNEGIVIHRRATSPFSLSIDLFPVNSDPAKILSTTSRRHRLPFYPNDIRYRSSPPNTHTRKTDTSKFSKFSKFRFEKV